MAATNKKIWECVYGKGITLSQGTKLGTQNLLHTYQLVDVQNKLLTTFIKLIVLSHMKLSYKFVTILYNVCR